MGKFSRTQLKKMKERPYYAVLHAINFIEGRLPEEAEKLIGSDPEACLVYAMMVMKGRLPEFLHNQMILSKWDEEQAKYVKEYLHWLSKG